MASQSPVEELFLSANQTVESFANADSENCSEELFLPANQTVASAAPPPPQSGLSAEDIARVAEAIVARLRQPAAATPATSPAPASTPAPGPGSGPNDTFQEQSRTERGRVGPGRAEDDDRGCCSLRWSDAIARAHAAPTTLSAAALATAAAVAALVVSSAAACANTRNNSKKQLVLATQKNT